MGHLNVVGTSKGMPSPCVWAASVQVYNGGPLRTGLLHDPPVNGPSVIPEVAAAKWGSGGQPERPFLLYSSFTRVLKMAVEILVSNPLPTWPPSHHVEPSPSPFSPPGPFSPGSGLALGRRLP